MFYYIKGQLALKGDNFIVIDANGVGYKIFTSLNTIQSFAELNKIAKVYTHLHIREDIMDIYGFSTCEELSMFQHLISVSGIGPKAALAILSVATPEKFALAVITNDTKTITKASGVGPKLAQRVILELKDKMKNMDALSEEAGNIIISDDAQSEAISALVVLGYSAQEAQKVISSFDNDVSVEEMIRQALKKLMK